MVGTPSSATLADRLYEHGVERAGELALEDTAARIDWQELDRRTNRIANALLANGTCKGDRVAVLSDQSIFGVLAILGILKAGASTIPIPTLVGADAIARIIVDSGARSLFISKMCLDLLPPRLAENDVSIVALDFDVSPFLSMADYLRDHAETPPGIAINRADEFNIIYSSGTTGHPKGIVHSHGLRAGAAEMLGPIAFPTGVRTLVTTALYSNWTLGAIIYTLWAGGSICLSGKFAPASLIDKCRAFEPDNVYLVPTQIARLLGDPDAAAELATLSPALKWSAGSYLSPELKRALLDQWPGGLLEIYGMTEGAPFTMLLAHAHPDKLHTVGRADPPDHIRIIDDDGAVLPTGERGEVVGRATNVMKGYNNDPEASKALLWRDAEGQSYFRSGDIGCLDEDGFLQITDRKKDMIISGGFNIYASDLEQVLSGHPDIAEAAVFGLPSADWGETPAAAVVLREGVATEDTALLEWANARLGKLQRISAVFIETELPRGSLDKVLKRTLREKYSNTGTAMGARYAGD
ncbi:class I adenylate-forming enzyme family protein [Parasphingopyxis sp.]|uniref:class I adenylate-forming enzyme family protein n=1 Tax=Parasphingopyxis sp. TaxID=1920299 RepID=UPI002621D72C|nr:class I adenylate-forming enzyme family protein [Parasphingopyxis sp.]